MTEDSEEWQAKGFPYPQSLRTKTSHKQSQAGGSEGTEPHCTALILEFDPRNLQMKVEGENNIHCTHTVLCVLWWSE